LCRERLRQFPSLVNCCTIDWFAPWPADALAAVAGKLLADVEGADVATRNTLANVCQTMHEDVRKLSESFRREAGRVNYVTPTSYLELLTMFTSLLRRQRGVLSLQQRRYTVRFDVCLTLAPLLSC
jgi:dynein heavy chain, axonemal